MKRLLTGAVALGLLTIPVVAHADLVSSLDFYGMARYSPAGGLNFDGPFDPHLGHVGLFGDETLLENDELAMYLNGGGRFHGIAAVAYDLTIVLPDDDVQRDWWLEYEAFVSGNLDESPIDQSFGGMYELKGMTQNQVLSGLKSTDIIDFLVTIPSTIQIGNLGWVVMGDDVSNGSSAGSLYAGLIGGEDTSEAAEISNLLFGGRFSLTAHKVPEPATLLMVGAGIAAVGIGHRRRRKQPTE